MDGLRNVAVAVRAKISCHHDIDPIADADQEAGKQRHQNGRRADRAQRLRPDKLSDHHNIGHVEQRLKQVGKHQWDTEEEKSVWPVFLRSNLW